MHGTYNIKILPSFMKVHFLLLNYESKVLLMLYNTMVILYTTSVIYKTCFVASQIVCLWYNSENKFIIPIMTLTECS